MAFQAGLATSTLFDFQKLPWLAGDKPLVWKTGGVTIDNTTITADASGDKLLPSGTIIGKAAGGKFQKAGVGTLGVPSADFNTGVGNGVFTVTAKDPSQVITVRSETVGGVSTPLAVLVQGNDVIIQLGTDGAGSDDPTKNTATLVIAALAADAQFADLASVVLKAGNDGTGVVGAFVEAGLTASALTQFLLLADEINAKTGDIVSGALHAAKVKESLLPDAVAGVLSEGLKALLPNVIFV